MDRFRAIRTPFFVAVLDFVAPWIPVHISKLAQGVAESLFHVAQTAIFSARIPYRQINYQPTATRRAILRTKASNSATSIDLDATNVDAIATLYAIHAAW
jgi:hypothetical protein